MSSPNQEKEMKEENTEKISRNFIQNIIDKDLEEGAYRTVVTRFPRTKRLSPYRACKVCIA